MSSDTTAVWRQILIKSALNSIACICILLSSIAYGGEYLYDYNDGSGTSLTGWTRYDEDEVGNPITNLYPGWIVEITGPHDGLKTYDSWGSRPGTYRMRCMDADISTSERAPSTSSGGSFRAYWTETDDCSTASYGNRPGWWLWHDGEPLSYKSTPVTTSDTDRMSFYMKADCNTVSRGNDTSLNEYTAHIGTHLCWDSGPGAELSGFQCPFESQNMHFYHHIVADPDVWVHVLLDQHPQTQREDHVWGNNPSYLEFSQNYFEHLHWMYLLLTDVTSSAGSMYVDEIVFESTAYDFAETTQNDVSICTVSVWYNSTTDKWGISWHDMSYEDSTGEGLTDTTMSTFQIRYSTSEITNSNWSDATGISGEYYTGTTHTGSTDLSIVRRSGPYNTQAFTQFELPDAIESGNSVIYFAIKDVSSTGGHIGSTFPYTRADDRNAVNDYVHTTWYDLAPSTTWYLDGDGDGWPNGTTQQAESDPGATWYELNELTGITTDCNDSNSDINPGATEICGDGIDNDCSDGDEACSVTATLTSGCSSTSISN